jgi:hypothetical protein
MFITGKAANCRRMKANSRRPAHFAVYHRCDHLTLKPAHRRRFSEVEMVVNGAGVTCDAEVNSQYLKNPGHNAAILATHPAEEEPADSAHFIRQDRRDISHVPLLSSWLPKATKLICLRGFELP